MIKKFMFTICLALIFSCSNNINETTIDEQNEEIVQVIGFDGLEKYLSATDDKLFVINFWATWCKPCIEELPYFEKITETYSADSVEVILVSLDFKKDLEQKLVKFVMSENIKSKVLLLDDTKYNEWIDKVSPFWSGAIPATLFHYHTKGIHDFYEQEFTEQELNRVLKEKLAL